MKRMRAILLVATLLAMSCGVDRCETPFGSGAVIDVYSPDFANLANIGGTVGVNRGHRGIMVRCESWGVYAAFEMTCPHDHDMRLEPDDEDFALMLKCPRCESRFDLINGNPCTGSATGCPLYRYETMFEEGHLLHIW